MKQIKLVFAIVTFGSLICFIQGHNEFHYVVGGDETDVTASATDISDWTVPVLFWHEIYWDTGLIPLAWDDSPQPYLLADGEFDSAIEAALDKWNTVPVGSDFFERVSITTYPKVLIRTEDWAGQWNGPDVLGKTAKAIGVDEYGFLVIVPDCSGDCQTLNPISGILFNTSSVFYNTYFWMWSDQSATDGQGRRGMDLQSVAEHEMGHLLGLGHCSESSALMWVPAPYGGIFRSITDWDRTGVGNLYGLDINSAGLK